MTQQFRKQLLAQIKDDSEEEDNSSPTKLPAIPPSPPHASKKELHAKDPLRNNFGMNPVQPNLSSSIESLESFQSDTILGNTSNPSSEVSKSGHPVSKHHGLAPNKDKEDKPKGGKSVFFELEGSAIKPSNNSN